MPDKIYMTCPECGYDKVSCVGEIVDLVHRWPPATNSQKTMKCHKCCHVWQLPWTLEHHDGDKTERTETSCGGIRCKS
jgi:uncharacterized Zn finger protein